MHLWMAERRIAFWVIVTFVLTTDLGFRIIVSEAFLLCYLIKESQSLCVDASWDESAVYQF